MKYDFSGRGASTNVRCTDGTMFHTGAFKKNDGKIVPLVWMHHHDDPEYVIGHALLENDSDGLNVYGLFNGTENGKLVKQMVEHGDVTSLSVWANHLKRDGNELYSGDVKEISLVLAGADPTARIEQTAVLHSDVDSNGDEILEAEIYSGEFINNNPGEFVKHAEEKKNTEEEKTVSDNPVDKKKTYKEIFDNMSKEQQDFVLTLLAYQEEQLKKKGKTGAEENTNGSDASDDSDENDETKHSDTEGDSRMKKNIFDTTDQVDSDVISHDDMKQLISDSIADAKKIGSLRDSFIAHAADYGIDNIDILFPDARTLTNSPDFIKRESAWVSTFMNGTRHSPFSRVKSVYANLTADEARARGYVKGKKKVEEVIALLKRSTDPQTIYKKQKLDRDDIIDITDFDVVNWLKGEMRIMLDEETAGAGLVGDGRLPSSDDKISEEHVRPIANDDDLYSYKIKVTDVTSADTAKAMIRAIILGYSNYKGSGNKTMFVKESVLAQMLLIEDGIGHLLYANQDALATTIRVKNIVEVPDEIFERSSVKPLAIILDLSDYQFGADKGGEVNTFDDFDIDYNQQKYLMETRCSGALIRPFSAMVINTTVDSTIQFKSPIKVDVNGKAISSNPSAGG